MITKNHQQFLYYYFIYTWHYYNWICNKFQYELIGFYSLSVSKMKENFLKWLNDYNYSQNTIRNYDIWLSMFFWFCNKIWVGAEECPESIKKTTTDWFVQHLHLRDLLPNTINLYLHAVRSFLKFLYIEEERSVLDWKTIRLLKETQKPIDFLEKQEIDKLIACAKKEKEPLKRVRNSLMIQILFTTGLRVSELVGLKVSDIGNDIQIIGKWGKLRVVYLPEKIINLAKFYVRRRQKTIQSDFLFVSHSSNSRWNQLSTSSVEFYLYKYGVLSWIGKKTNPHVLRHSFATHIYRKGALSKDVQVLMWHAHMSTTEKYIRTKTEFVKKTAMLAR